MKNRTHQTLPGQSQPGSQDGPTRPFRLRTFGQGRGPFFVLLALGTLFLISIPVVTYFLANYLSARSKAEARLTPTAVTLLSGSNPTLSEPMSTQPGMATMEQPSAQTGEAPSQTITPGSTTTLQSTGEVLTQPPPCTAIGQTWVRPIDQMVMVCVPAGSFTMGLNQCTFQGCQQEVQGGTVDLPAYWIDSTEVTNRMYEEFATRTGYVSGAEKLGASEVYGILTPVSGANWRSPQGGGSSIATQGDHPVVQMNWYAAHAYCLWAGGSLPSEAEWEKAARGTDGRLWPWGNSVPSAQLVNAADVSLPAPQSRTDQNDGFRYTAPVGSFPLGQSPYGVMDMAGNAWEWTRSLFRPYPYQADDGREIQDAPGSGDRVVLRGGCWFDDYGAIRSTLRYGGLPEGTTDGIGFRCVYP